MSESLASRVGRIVSGSLHALIDGVESAAPEHVLEEAIREIEAATDEVRAELGRELARKHLASARLIQINTQHEDLSEKIELALREQREELACAAASQQLDIEAQIPVLERTLSECGDREKDLEGFIAALLAKRRQMREELADFIEARRSAANGDSGVSPGKHRPGVDARVDQATSAFDRVLERHTRIPLGARAVQTDKSLRELEDLARAHRVKERIAIAKARVAEK